MVLCPQCDTPLIRVTESAALDYRCPICWVEWSFKGILNQCRSREDPAIELIERLLKNDRPKTREEEVKTELQLMSEADCEFVVGISEEDVSYLDLLRFHQGWG